MPVTCSKPRLFTGEAPDLSLVPMVEVVVRMPLDQARRLAAHKRERGRLDILADEAKEVGTPVLDALCAAGVDR